MKICFLGDGNSVHIKRWLYFFEERGHEVHIITFSKVELDNIIVHKIGDFDININGNNWKYILKSREIKKCLMNIKPDIVNAHFVTSYGFISALTGIKPLVISAWGTDILVTPKKNLIYKNITKYALNRACLVTSDSKYMSQETEKLTKTRVITVPMGVEEELCYMDRKECDEIRILSLRTVNKNSNIDIIVKAFALLKKKLVNKKMKLIVTNDGPEMKDIIKLVKELNIEDSVEIKGFVNRNELLNLLFSSNMYITIPTSDSTSVTLLEAMAAGITVVGSNIAANKEWINNGENGLILNEMNEEKLLECMLKGIMDEELRKRVKDINRKIILKRALWKNNMIQVENEYLNIINNDF